ncbi:MAG: proprotein convertase P-domain-containing protein [Phycisphaerales bacterium]
MRSHVCFFVVSLALSVVSEPALGGGTSTVYVYGGSFSQRIPADVEATRGWMQDAVLTVPDHLIICDVDVFLSIRHTAAFDLQLFLLGPSDAMVTLNTSDPFEGYYEGADYIATTFDDEADAEIADARPPFAGSFRPRDSLTAFDGQDAHGDWRLLVYDAYFVNTGCLDSFVLRITVSLPEAPVAVPIPPAGGLTLLGLALVGRRAARSRR